MIRPLLPGTGSIGPTLDLGRVLGATGPRGVAAAAGFVYQAKRIQALDVGQLDSSGAGEGFTFNFTDSNGITFDSNNMSKLLRGNGELIYLLGASGGTGHRIFRVHEPFTVASTLSSTAVRFSGSGVSIVTESAADFPADDAYVSLLVVPAGGTGSTGSGFTGAGISGGHLVVRPVAGGSGSIGPTLDLGRVVGPTAAFRGVTGQFLFIDDGDLGSSGSTALHFDLDNQLPKLDLYREKIHQLTSTASSNPTISIDAANGPIQRIELTSIIINSVSINLVNTSASPWLSGQGVTVIIEPTNMTNNNATWIETNTNDRFYNATPDIVENRTTLLYVVGYGNDDVGGALSTTTNQRWYITSQTFGPLS